MTTSPPSFLEGRIPSVAPGVLPLIIFPVIGVSCEPNFRYNRKRRDCELTTPGLIWLGRRLRFADK